MWRSTSDRPKVPSGRLSAEPSVPTLPKPNLRLCPPKVAFGQVKNVINSQYRRSLQRLKAGSSKKVKEDSCTRKAGFKNTEGWNSKKYASTPIMYE